MTDPKQRPEKILIRGVNWLGDAVMSTPALMRLRAAKPSAHLALLTADKLAGLWQGHPAIDEVIAFSKAEGVGRLSTRLRESGFDLALILPNSFRSAFESWLAGIPVRIGYGGRGRNLLLTRVVPRRKEEIPMLKRSGAEVQRLITRTPDRPRDVFPASAHHLHQYLWLARALGADPEPLAPHMAVTDDERTAFRREFGVNGGPVIGLNPGAEYGPAKRWPAERFIEAAGLIHAVAQPAWIIFGGPADARTASQIESGLHKICPNARIGNVAGRTGLRQLCAGLAACDVVLTNDTGPMHLAAAVGSRVVVPFGSTSPELTGPGLPGDPGRHGIILGAAPCAPCFLRVCPVDFRCMLSISARRIADAVLAAVADPLPRRT